MIFFSIIPSDDDLCHKFFSSICMYQCASKHSYSFHYGKLWREGFSFFKVNNMKQVLRLVIMRV